MVLHDAMGVPRPPTVDSTVLARAWRHIPEEENQQRPEGLWVKSANDTGGPYTVAIGWGDDTQFHLTNNRAYRYGQTVIAVATAIDYDAALMRKFRKIDIDLPGCVRAAHELRKLRPPADLRATSPLTFVGGCTRKLEPFVTLWHGKTEIGQLTVPATLYHGLSVLQAFTQVASDNLMLRMLGSYIGLDPMHSRRMVYEMHEELRQYQLVENPDTPSYLPYSDVDGDVFGPGDA